MNKRSNFRGVKHRGAGVRVASQPSVRRAASARQCGIDAKWRGVLRGFLSHCLCACVCLADQCVYREATDMCYLEVKFYILTSTAKAVHNMMTICLFIPWGKYLTITIAPSSLLMYCPQVNIPHHNKVV